jgi:tetratricopeptide (TPR) repeat protein
MVQTSLLPICEERKLETRKSKLVTGVLGDWNEAGMFFRMSKIRLAVLASNPDLKTAGIWRGSVLLLAALISLAAIGQCAEVGASPSPAVRGWEGSINLPTYALGEEDPNPPFPILNRRNIYPYTMLDDLTDRREVKTYQAIFLENEYLKATILPDVGGRLYSLFDKISKREVFYRNNVVKYGLVALRGAWISGGIEFNFPNGHTVVTVSPVSSRMLASSPEKASAVVGGMDWVSGMYWQVELTLHSGEARLEQRVTLFNPTPLENLYWYWANAAVPATNDMQFIYPMREANPHSHSEIWSYPVWNGVDYSWYKNIRQPTSLFGLGVHRNFFGAYYHKSDYGVVHWADYHDVPGKKIWSWGGAGDGLVWTDLLTDQDGPYNEIQAGRFETQLSQEFMPPHHVESWTEYWYPVRGLGGGFVEATDELALNVKFIERGTGVPPVSSSAARVEIALNPTIEIRGAKVSMTLDGKPLREFGPTSFSPTTTVKFEVAVNDLEQARKSLSVEVEDSESRSLLHWSAADPVDGNPAFVSAAGAQKEYAKPPNPMHIEEIYLRGVDQEKHGDAEGAAKTYELTLQSDREFIPALLKLAWRDYQAVDFEAFGKIMAAERRDNTDPAVQYAAGVIDHATGNLTQAQDAFWRSIQFHASPAAALAQLGEIAIEQHNYRDAERLLRQSLSFNPEDAMVLSDLSVALRLNGKPKEAGQAADRAAQRMPLLPFAAEEASSFASVDAQAWRRTFAQDVQNYLEVAAWYRSLGDLDASDKILQAAVTDLPADKLSPVVYYYLAANSWQHGQAGQARGFVERAASAVHVRVFPQRLSDALVLEEIAAFVPNDGLAPYLLGTFLFAHGRYDDAAKEWLTAKQLGFEDPVLERNLGVYEWRVKKDLPQAAAYYEKAIQLAPAEYRYYADLDDIYTQMGDVSRRQKLFASAPEAVLDRDIIRARLALLLVEQRQFDQALAILMNHHFKPWEGGQIIREIFVLAELEKGKRALESKSYAGAERSFRQALEYPVNLGVGMPDKPHDEEAWYWLGVALAAEDKTGDAQQAWNTAMDEGRTRGGPAAVFAAGALQKLGQTPEAEKMLAAVAERANEPEASAQALYAAGLAERFRNHEDAAQADFRRCLELDPLLWQARFELDRGLAAER